MLATKNRPVSIIGHVWMIWMLTLVATFIFVRPTHAQEDASATAKPIEAKPRHWHKYVNRAAGFSIWYPDPYRPIPLPPPDAGDKWRHWDKRLLLLQRSDDKTAEIAITLDTRPFNLSTISHYHSPTGWDVDWPPKGPTIGHHTFYAYGGGGGGVDYPDQYIVRLRGRMLEIYFDGPYEGKSPGGETPSLEPKILKTFRVL
jgi:hypothetical protein